MNRFELRTRWPQATGVLFWAAALTCIQCLSQPALTPGAPALPPSSIAPVITPSTPAISTASLAAQGTTATNFSISGLAQQLAGLKLQLEQALPVLNAFNNSFDFISVGSQTNGTGVAGTGANFSSSSGANLSSNLGANFSSSVAVPTLNTQSGSSLNAFGLPPGLGVAPITSETLRALLVLESDMQRMLPTLSALTGDTNTFTGLGLTPGFSPGAVTNVFIAPATFR